MANNFYGAIALTGGGTGALDKIDGDDLADLDAAFVQVLGTFYAYTLDDDSGAAEDSPNVISPDANAGTKRWLLQGILCADLDVIGGVVLNSSGNDNNIQMKGSTDDSLLFLDAGLDRVGIGVGLGASGPVTKLTVAGTITLKEQADADGDTGTYGQIWVNTATPNELFFTDDSGLDFRLGVIESGDTLPASPVIGQPFLHNPTGRLILYVYDGSDWRTSAIEAFGSMTLFVDETDGSDTVDKGTAVTTNAFATIQFAIDTIPPIFNGNVIINITGADYAEDLVILGKKAGGNYTIQLVGTMTDQIGTRNATAGADATVTIDGAALTINAHIGQTVRFTAGTGDGQEAIILSNTTTVITIVGFWKYSYPHTTTSALGVNPDATTDVVIEDWTPTTVDSIEVGAGQTGVELYHLVIDDAAGTLGNVHAHDLANVSVDVSKVGDSAGALRSIFITESATANIRACIVLAGVVWNLNVLNGLCNASCTWFDREGITTSFQTVVYQGSIGNFLACRVDDPPSGNDNMVVQANASILFGFSAKSGNVLTGSAGGGVDLQIQLGGGVRSAANVNNTYGGGGKTVDGATFGWED